MGNLRYNISAQELGEVRSVCVIAWGLLGDVFIRIPVIEKLKQCYPDAHLTVIVDSAGVLAIKDHPDIDELLVMQRAKKPLWRYIKSTFTTIIHLRKRKLDLSVNLYSGGSSPGFVKWMNARVRLGFDHSKALQKSNNLFAHHPTWCRQWIKDFALVLEPLGINPDSVRVGSSFYFPDEAREFASRTLNTDAKHITFNLGAGDISKCWPVESYVELAERLQSEHSFVPVLLTNPGQEYLAEKFTRLFSGKLIQLPVVSLDKVGAIMHQSEYVITGDTSLMHVAFGLHCPTLVIFAYTRPEWIIVEDCLLEYCFKENPENIHKKCQQPMGSKDMTVAEVYAKFLKLQSKVHKTG